LKKTQFSQLHATSGHQHRSAGDGKPPALGDFENLLLNIAQLKFSIKL